MALSKEQMAKRAAKEFKNGDYINLGIGLPTLVANYIPSHIEVLLHTENGLLGMGGYPTEHEVDADLINAGKETITYKQGACFFNSADSFAMIRGGHLNLTILGAFEVDVFGNIASWMIPNKLIKGMGGAMDLVASSSRILVMMTHCDKKGNPKLLKKCQLPLTGVNCITEIITDLGLFKIENQQFHLLEKAPNTTIEEIEQKTEGNLIINHVQDMII